MYIVHVYIHFLQPWKLNFGSMKTTPLKLIIIKMPNPNRQLLIKKISKFPVVQLSLFRVNNILILHVHATWQMYMYMYLLLPNWSMSSSLMNSLNSLGILHWEIRRELRVYNRRDSNKRGTSEQNYFFLTL